MDRRIHNRKYIDADVNVYLSYEGKRVGSCSAGNLSISGVFLHTDIDLPEDTLLELSFVMGSHSSSVISMHQLTGVVARKDSDGLGVIFRGKKRHQANRNENRRSIKPVDV